MKKLTLVLLVITFFSCKNEENVAEKAKQQNNKLEQKIEKKNRLVFEIDFKTTKPDDFILFSNDVFLNNSQFMNFIITHKMNSNENQKVIKFEVPDEIKPDVSLGLILGRENEKAITVKLIKVHTNNVEYLISPDELNDYFTFNKFIEYNPETGIINTKRIDGKYNPTMFLRKKIINKLFQ